MPQAASPANWTVAMLDELEDDGQRYEIIDGELFVTPAPSDVHQLIVAAFHRRFHDYVRPSNLARVIHSPADVRKAEQSRNRVQPDVFVIRLVDGKRPAYPFDVADLLLAVEVQSPSNPFLDYQIKRELYLKNGVAEYWIVNTDARIVSRWRHLDDPGEVYSRSITWHPAGMVKPLAIDLPPLFEDALG